MSLNENMIGKAAEIAINNPKTAILIPASVAVAGKMSEIAQIQSWMTIVSMGVGIFVSAVVAVHWIIKTGNALLERQEIKNRIRRDEEA